VSFLLVASLAFGMSTVVFTTYALIRQTADLATLLAAPLPFAALNLATAVAWLSFFFGLQHLEPAVVATLYNGVGPLTVLIFETTRSLPQYQKGTLETAIYLGVAGTLIALAVVVLTDRSGMGATSTYNQIIAIMAVVSGGAMITLSHMIARWFDDRGVGTASVMGTRFLLTLAIAVGAELVLGRELDRPALASIPALATMAFLLITVPSFMLQLGVARTRPLAANVFRALGSVFVFGVQQSEHFRYRGISGAIDREI
jgi:hypothetical protein